MKEYSVSMLKEARELYVGQKLSCRGVSRTLREKYGHDNAPSQQWVCVRMKELGVLRSKTQSDRLMNGRLNGVDYAAKERQAIRLYGAPFEWSTRKIAERLEVSRTSVCRWVRKAGIMRTPSDATRHAAWDADTPAARARRERIDEVARLRAEGQTYRQIRAETGLAVATIGRYLEAARIAEGDTRLRRSNQRPTCRHPHKTSKYRGVHWSRSSGKWVAQITIHGERHHLGSFETSTDAAHAYDAMCLRRELYDRLNFKESIPPTLRKAA